MRNRSVLLRWSLAPALALAVSAVSAAPPVPARVDDASLARGGRPDTTAEQRYQSAIREAGGGLKVALEECRQGGAPARKACESEARKRYQADMAEARSLRRNPDARPVNVTGGPIKETETRTVVRP
ncbi:hypothetical protein [Acidovorax sp. NCPPB 4044]|uniref:hypothetical protein n=1 Tax=Acidovorax sp. NCPPB 4044 TaxID=2940490 RepID=UPI002302B3E2|nr:hypothetical protein [Acidovorax sp. NCPPB 4044]MDA8520892.1 hypothetical protein [Acidovorax sp. NCPPB 4044]